MTSTQKRDKLQCQIWQIANDVRGSANGYASEVDIKGLFADFDTTSNRLGNSVKEKNLRLSASSYVEQKKIVKFLDLTSKEIDLLEELKNQKEKYCQEVFSNILKNGAIK